MTRTTDSILRFTYYILKVPGEVSEQQSVGQDGGRFQGKPRSPTGGATSSCLSTPQPLHALLPAPSSVIALVALRAEASYLPAPTWPLEAALESLLNEASAEGALRAALARLSSAPHGPDHRVPGVRRLLRELVVSGRLNAEGSGWDARFRLDSEWVNAHSELYLLLSPEDRRALDRAAQRLEAMATMLSKKSAA